MTSAAGEPVGQSVSWGGPLSAAGKVLYEFAAAAITDRDPERLPHSPTAAPELLQLAAAYRKAMSQHPSRPPTIQITDGRIDDPTTGAVAPELAETEALQGDQSATGQSVYHGAVDGTFSDGAAAVAQVELWLKECLPGVKSDKEADFPAWTIQSFNPVQLSVMVARNENGSVIHKLMYHFRPTKTQPKTTDHQLNFTREAFELWCKAISSPLDLNIPDPDVLIQKALTKELRRSLPYEAVGEEHVGPQAAIPGHKRSVPLVVGESGAGKTVYATLILREVRKLPRLVVWAQRPDSMGGSPLFLSMIATLQQLDEQIAKEVSSDPVLSFLRAVGEASCEPPAPLAPDANDNAKLEYAAASARAENRRQFILPVLGEATREVAAVREAYSNRRSTAIEVATRLLIDAASDAAEIPLRIWKDNPNRCKSLQVTFVIDEIGRCLGLARGLISAADFIHRTLAEASGFAHVELVLCGTGSDALTQPAGCNRTATDPTKVRVIRLRPHRSDSEAAKNFRDKLLGVYCLPAVDFAKLSKRNPMVVLSPIWTNARMAAKFVQTLSESSLPTQWSADCWSEIMAAARASLVNYITLNGLADLAQREKQLCFNAVYYALARQKLNDARPNWALKKADANALPPHERSQAVSLVSRGVCQGVWADPKALEWSVLAAVQQKRQGSPGLGHFLTDTELAAVLQHSQNRGLIEVDQSATPHRYTASQAIEMAVCSDSQQWVFPECGADFEDLAMLVARRHCEIEGYDTRTVELSEPYPADASKPDSRIIERDVREIVAHLRRPTGPTAVAPSGERAIPSAAAQGKASSTSTPGAPHPSEASPEAPRQPPPAASLRRAAVLRNGDKAMGADVMVLRVDHQAGTGNIVLHGLKHWKARKHHDPVQWRKREGWEAKFKRLVPLRAGDSADERLCELVCRGLRWILAEALGKAEAPQSVDLHNPPPPYPVRSVLQESLRLEAVDRQTLQGIHSDFHAVRFREHLGLHEAFICERGEESSGADEPRVSFPTSEWLRPTGEKGT